LSVWTSLLAHFRNGALSPGRRATATGSLKTAAGKRNSASTKAGHCRVFAAAAKAGSRHGARRRHWRRSSRRHTVTHCAGAQASIRDAGGTPIQQDKERGMSQLSQSIVDFIAQLHPLYTSQFADGHECALSLLDGTLILPVDESSCEKEEGWVAVFWQGDSRRCSEVPGAQLASVAIWRHLQSTGYGRSAEETLVQREQMMEQFHRRTGCPLQREAIALQ
jgi:hypothetical protein